MSRPFRVVAIVSTFNEADILPQVLSHLHTQGVETYVIDDQSTDGSADIASAADGVIGVERRSGADPKRLAWAEILERKAAIAAELDADWFIHHDADEFRETPWTGVSLRDGIEHVSSLGYSAIDFAVLDFRPVNDRFKPGLDVRDVFAFYEPAGDFDRVQIKAWRRQDVPVDLVASGGHDVRFPGRAVCPIKFLLRHYPIRSPEHGRRKVFAERLPRFREDERARQWHRQYDRFAAERRANAFLWNADDLVRYDEHAVKRSLAESADGAGALLALEDELRVSRHALESVSAECEDLRRRGDHARRELKSLQGRLEVERSRQGMLRDELGSEIRARDAELERLSRHLQAVFASASWRVTAPLRSVYARIASVEPEPRPEAASGPPKTAPVSTTWGLDRGRPVDRYYIENFLETHCADIAGRVLEIKDPGYTRQFGGSRVTESIVLDVSDDNPQATVVGDLAASGSVDLEPVDCFVLTQTLHIIYDIRAAIAHAGYLVRPGGVLLCTLPAVSRVSDEDGGLASGDFWRVTRAAVERLFADACPGFDVEVATWGNVRVCSAFLYGFAVEELTPEELNFADPWFPLLHGVRAVRKR